jgi:hypothetical protein
VWHMQSVTVALHVDKDGHTGLDIPVVIGGWIEKRARCDHASWMLL